MSRYSYRYILFKSDDPTVNEVWAIVDTRDWSLVTTGGTDDTPGHLFISYEKAWKRYVELDRVVEE